MKNILLLFAIIFLVACNKSDDTGKPTNTEIPNCIQTIIDDSDLSSDIKRIRAQEIDGENHYWLNTEFTFFDGVEVIVNAQCDTICGFCGECIPAECSFQYDNDDWVIIWEP